MSDEREAIETMMETHVTELYEAIKARCEPGPMLMTVLTGIMARAMVERYGARAEDMLDTANMTLRKMVTAELKKARH